jgi:hypothetical protein
MARLQTFVSDAPTKPTFRVRILDYSAHDNADFIKLMPNVAPVRFRVAEAAKTCGLSARWGPAEVVQRLTTFWF